MANLIVDSKTNKTGHKLGTLSPTIWWENAKEVIHIHGCPINKHILIPPTEIGDGGRLARMLFEDNRIPGRLSYKDRGYQWNEARTLREVQTLQNRWEEQEMRVLRHMGHYDHEVRKKVHSEVAGRLRQTMSSSSTSQFERDFIRLWLDLRNDKQDQYTKKWEDKIMYSQALEFDAGHHLEDRMGE